MAKTGKVKKKTAPKTAPKKKMPARRTPAHGNGELLVGGVPGNKGNRNAVGRPRSAIREASALEYDKRIGALGTIADSTDLTPSDRLRAIDILGKHGGVGQRPTVDRDLIRMLAADVAAEIDDDEVLNRIYDRWTQSIGARVAGDI